MEYFMKDYKKVKVTIVGAGSVSFCPCTIIDILLSGEFSKLPLEISFMDINADVLPLPVEYAKSAAKHMKRDVKVSASTVLDEALADADFVITAIEVKRSFYWSQDWHVLRKYGFRQIFAENGGAGSMFHTLRNYKPVLDIAYAMERVCPDAFLFNFTNPEAKLVEAVLKLTKVRAVGLCHGTNMGIEQVAEMIDVKEEDIDVDACGLNHFGWFQRIEHKQTGEDLYPVLFAKERKIPWNKHWDHWALSRVMLRLYGMFPYPGTSHIGEYIAWSDGFAGEASRYFYDPMMEDPWGLYPDSKRGPVPRMNFDRSGRAASAFKFKPEHVEPSGEVAVFCMDSMVSHKRREIVSVNLLNKGLVPNLPDDLCIEVSAYADAEDVHGKQMKPLPLAVAQMISTQAAIHQLILEAYTEKSRTKLLQAMLLDPTVSSYYNAVHAIDEMCELQKDILPPLHW